MSYTERLGKKQNPFCVHVMVQVTQTSLAFHRHVWYNDSHVSYEHIHKHSNTI